MRITLISLFLTAVAALTASLAGCGSDSSETPTSKVAGTPPSLGAEQDQGDHEGHDHGDEAGHEHPTEGPHGGHLIELGNEEYHAELLHDERTHTVTIYLLDAAGKEPVVISQPELTVQLFQGGQFVKYALKAVAGPGGSASAASRFEIVDATLCDALSHGDETRGRLQVTINGKPYTGAIQHTTHGDHDHADHDHAGDDHAGDDHAGHEH